MSDNSSGVAMLICRSRKCKHKNILVAATNNYQYCTACGARLKRADQAELTLYASTLFESGGMIDTPPPTTQTGLTVISNSAESGRKRHWTSWNGHSRKKDQKLWSCWCGFETNDDHLAFTHDDPALHAADNTSNKPSPSPSRSRGNSSNDTFTCAADIKGCPLQSAKPIIRIPHLMFNQWIWLAKRMDTEWIAFLKGRTQQPGEDGAEVLTYHIDSMYFPEQEASGAYCEAKDGQIEADTIAAVHSHVGMNVFFSGTDEAHMNHIVEMVINRRAEIATSCRVKLECGRFARAEGRVLLVGSAEDNTVFDNLKAKLSERKYSTRSEFAPRGSSASSAASYNSSAQHYMEGWSD